LNITQLILHTESEESESLSDDVDERQTNFQNVFVSHFKILNDVIIHEWADSEIQLQHIHQCNLKDCHLKTVSVMMIENSLLKWNVHQLCWDAQQSNFYHYVQDIDCVRDCKCFVLRCSWFIYKNNECRAWVSDTVDLTKFCWQYRFFI